MAKISVKAGTTSLIVNVFIMDSASTTGAGKTGLVYNTASLTAYYCLPGAAAAAITLATQTVTGAYSSGGFVEIDATNMPGWYRFDVPNAAVASGRFSSIHFKGASGMAPLPLEIELTAVDNSDAVRYGLTALPNVASGSAGAIITSGTGTAQLSVASGVAQADVAKWLGTAASTPTVAGVPNVNCKTWNDLATVALPLVPTTAGRTLDVSAAGEAGIDWANIGSPTTAVNLSGTNIDTDQVVASVTGAVGSVTGNVGGNVTGSVGSVVGAVGSVIGNVGGNVEGSIAGFTVAALAQFFLDDTNEAYASAVAGSVVKEIADNAGAAGDPWSTAIPGAYSAGTAGYIIGNNLNATVSSRASQTSVDAVDDYIDTEITAIYNRLGAPAGASMSADIAAVKVDTAAILVDTGTTLDARIPAALTGAGNMKCDMLAIDGETTSADRLAASTKAIAKVVVAAGSTTTSINTTSIDPSATTSNQFAGQLLMFLADTTTAALRGQKQAITASSAGGVLTTDAFTTAPAAGDTATIC